MKLTNLAKFTIATIAVTTCIVFFLYFQKNPLIPKLAINGHVFTYDLAITKAQQERGLSGKKELAENHGMLFKFNRKEQFFFWMKEMNFPIDIIWIDDKTIVDISKNVPVPFTNNEYDLPKYAPKRPVNIVFEVAAGTTDKLNIKAGDEVQFRVK